MGANTDEPAIVNPIAEHKGIQQRQQKKWAMFLGEFCIVAFATAPALLHSLHQKYYVSCHLGCLLIQHCLLPRRAANGNMLLPQDRLLLLREIAQATLHYCDSAHASPI